MEKKRETILLYTYYITLYIELQVLRAVRCRFNGSGFKFRIYGRHRDVWVQGLRVGVQGLGLGGLGLRA